MSKKQHNNYPINQFKSGSQVKILYWNHSIEWAKTSRLFLKKTGSSYAKLYKEHCASKMLQNEPGCQIDGKFTFPLSHE